jgi:hypothetical protein
MSKIKLLLAAAAIGGSLTASAASAAPIAPVSTSAAANVEQVRWVCGAYGRCWYGYAYAPRPYNWRHRYWRRHYW